MDVTQLTTDERQWFVMRDLKRRNAKQPAYLMFKDKGMEFFTPMVHKLLTIHGKREDREVPFMQDLLFVKETKEKLDIIVEAIPTLQYRYKLGVQHTPHCSKEHRHGTFYQGCRSHRKSEILPAGGNNPGYAEPQDTHHRRTTGWLYRNFGDDTGFQNKTALGGTAHVIGSGS